jgi:peptidoglycan/xylan/chitin deacetylase (PgdA/CDA1 family)
MTRSRTTAAALAAFSFLMAACGDGGRAADGAAPAGQAQGDSAAPPAATAQAGPANDAGPKADLPPNELGRIMVLEYHRLGPPDAEGEFIRTLEHFRNDLKILYEAGYRPVTMRQVLEGDINLPAGTTPVVFTFDDSTRGQFYYLPSGEIDPSTMVGSWVSFRERNPAWSGGATWCVLPGADHPSNFFHERTSRRATAEERKAREEGIRKKVTWLVDNGHEICNHTWYHERLDRAKDDKQAQEFIGIGEDSIRAYLPEGYDIVTLALPLGMWPKNRPLAWQGTYRDGKRYENKVILEVSGGPNVSPWDKRWDAHSVDRFIVAPNALERQLAAWARNPADRYVSDGDPNTVSFPQRMEQHLNRAALGSRTAKVVADAAPAAAPAPGTAPAPAPATGTSR